MLTRMQCSFLVLEVPSPRDMSFVYLVPFALSIHRTRAKISVFIHKMVFCVVVGCNNNNNKSSKDYNVECRYFSFPKSQSLCVKWVHKCYQQRKFNIKTARIFSKHFLNSDFCKKEKLLKLPFKSGN